MNKILFLHTEFAGYFLNCVQTLTELYDVEVHIVRWPVNQEAPFNFPSINNVFFYERKDYTPQTLLDLVKNINPDLIYCGGWMDSAYLPICKRYREKIPTVLGLDNQWKGTLKQYLMLVLSRLYFKELFTHVWVPGESQAKYAKLLGFGGKKILKGLYSADVKIFQKTQEQCKDEKRKNFPKRFLYVGRYIESKGVKELWGASAELCAEDDNPWELWCAGTGDLDNQFPKHSKIKNLGFIQPAGLQDIVKDAGVFILPSHFEPWGVVVHEFAAAGFPLICSREVGAASLFLREGENGFFHKAGDKGSLKRAMKQMMSLSDETLKKMGDRSVELSRQITPQVWARTLGRLLTEK